MWNETGKPKVCTGRKHQHRPSSRVMERRKAAERKRLAHLHVIFKAKKARIAAYWRGELEEYPA